jgi:outer membrane usher protein
MARLAWPASNRFTIAEILINNVAQRPAMIALAPDGVILARRDDVTGWNIDISRAPIETLQDIAHIRLTALPGIRARFDGSTLTVDAAESAFQGSRIDLRKNSARTVDGGAGAYVNYDVSSFASRGQRPASAAAVEGVFYRDTMSVASNGVVSSFGTRHQFVRQDSTLRWDFPDQVRSLVLGDAIARAGGLARAFRFGGISYGTNFATRPDMVTFALPAVPGESRIPTAAEMLINGQTHSRLDLAAGPFEISNVPAINGAGEIQLVTRDMLGRQQVLVVPYYVTPSLLQPDLTDSGFEAGRIRENFGIDSFDYGRVFARGTLRRGITPGLTAEAFAEVTGGQRVAAAGATAALGHFAIASAAVAHSTGGKSGTSVSASLERSAREFSFGLRAQYMFGEFNQLGEAAGLRYRYGANAGVSLGPWGNLSLLHAAESRVERGRLATTAFSYHKQIGKTLSLLANFSESRSEDGVRHFVGLAIAVPLDALASASLMSSRQNGSSEHVLDMRQNLPTDEGWAARTRLVAANAQQRRMDAGVSWQNGNGLWSADASHVNGGDNIRVGMTGSLVLAGGAIHAVRQLGEAFAVVSVPGFAGVDVYYENQRVARTDSAGFAVIPRLRPYELNTVNLDTLKLSLSTELSTPRRVVSPARRGGVLLQFKTTTTRGALVRLVRENGEPVPAGALVRLHDEDFPVAAHGEAWVTGLDAEATASVTWRDQRCSVRIPVPEGPGARPRIGPLSCRGAGA